MLGGAYGDRAPDATAFPHRDGPVLWDAVVAVPSSLVESLPPEAYGLMEVPVNLTNTFLLCVRQPAPALRLGASQRCTLTLIHAPAPSPPVPSIRPCRAITPYMGNAAYVNYMPDSLANYGQAYWAGNYPRLQAIKAAYDPLGVFDKPGTAVGATLAVETVGVKPAAPAPAPFAAASARPRRRAGGACAHRRGVRAPLAQALGVVAAAILALLL